MRDGTSMCAIASQARYLYQLLRRSVHGSREDPVWEGFQFGIATVLKTNDGLGGLDSQAHTEAAECDVPGKARLNLYA
eukprot:6195916-Pleurochrysis_carterae.AAC.3